MPQDDERQLIERARRGNRGALGELYRRHVDAIYRYVHLRVGDPTVAEDLTAEVFLRALEGLGEYRYTGVPLIAWLYRIARARTADHWRRAGRYQEIELSDKIAATGSDPEVIASARIERSDLVAALRRLTDNQQQVIILRFVEEMSLAQAAAVMGKTVGAVKALQHRALASLARLMGEQRKGIR
ncbi:MAG: sigma-70 family RNA polymerase sigma factor [Anaerolineae bacterium]